jgi:hypothetical protein
MFMKQTLIILADLGNFKAYQWDGAQFQSTPRLELIEASVAVDAHSKRANTLTVLEGRSAKGGSNSAMAGRASDGEQHNMQNEKRRRSVRQMAEHIDDLVRRKGVDRCFLAAPHEIHRQLLDEISPDARRRMEKSLPLDLTMLDKSELIRHFFAESEAANK